MDTKFKNIKKRINLNFNDVLKLKYKEYNLSAKTNLMLFFI